MTWVEMFTELFKLSVIVVSELVKLKNAHDTSEADAALDRAKFEKVISDALETRRNQAALEAKQVGNVDDEEDQEMKK